MVFYILYEVTCSQTANVDKMASQLRKRRECGERINNVEEVNFTPMIMFSQKWLDIEIIV